MGYAVADNRGGGGGVGDVGDGGGCFEAVGMGLLDGSAASGGACVTLVGYD